ncbi:mannose-1-phosphate guanylyltransferase [Saprolegnia diclina VS20]|uniref:mannose-1-phosphate guanylyltransferase n=1 Tax=Saprolegnia diclina (strain VS20) TaxID=1156394 RepID=T0Q9G6_SAPDV|nr:mannose-1-phosphate guanylyltransferase [Saprolegnia diclina VS20]EQC34519.1 mannose-1-phosphate guanylyltransferase [Saprolegnia diclina VS20]|eukprot:XP_008611925.1 mannose-1-phosphate guanylyltransferase [Saprolegnia diclina VS20]
MKGLILIGGFGTRLRPLTLSTPTPLVDFCNKSLVRHQIEALAAVGVDEVILAINYQPATMLPALAVISRDLGIKITCSHETEPLGTAGPLALARAHLEVDEPFFVINSDIMADFTALAHALSFHRAHGAEGTILLTQVDEPSNYGVVLTDLDGSGRVDRFIEKPREFVGNIINAGIYIFEREILDRIQLRPTSMETEIFPQMAAEGNLFSMRLPGYWTDVGQPKDFLTGMCKHLEHLCATSPHLLTTGVNFVGHVLVDPSASIGDGCLIGPDVVIGAGCVVEEGVRLSQTTLLRDVTVRSNSWIHNSIIGWGSTIGRWCRLEGTTVLGEDVQVKDERFINGGMVLPHRAISTNIPEPGTIVM